MVEEVSRTWKCSCNGDFSECLCGGFGVDENEELSNVWAKEALSSNNSFAVAFCYFNGLGTESDCKKAFLFFEASAKEHDEFGQLYLGYCFRYGYVTQRNYEKAFNVYLKGAEQGNCKAQHDVGDMYRFGKECEKDEQKAVIWYKKAAKQGNEFSVTALKEMRIKVE